MATISAGFVVIVFAVIAHYSGVVSRGREAISIARSASLILRDKLIEDSEKEQILQRYSLRLFGLFGLLVLGGAMALLVPFSLLWLIEIAGYPIIDETFRMLKRWEFMIGAAIAGVVIYYCMWRRLP